MTATVLSRLEELEGDFEVVEGLIEALGESFRVKTRLPAAQTSSCTSLLLRELTRSNPVAILAAIDERDRPLT